MDENNLNTIIGISEIVLFVALTILAIYLITFMKKFLFSIAKIESEISDISDNLTPVITDLKLITDDVKVIVDRSRVQFGKIEDLSEALVDKGTGLLNTINKVQNVSNGFLLNTTNLVSAISKGVKTFGNKLKNGSQLQLKSFD
ncbi:MAG: hypothetical protein ABI840_02690 [bacterium]